MMFYVKFLDLSGKEWEVTREFDTTQEDSWYGDNYGDEIAFEYNIFDTEVYGNQGIEGLEWYVNVYQLNPDYKRNGQFTLDGMKQITVVEFAFFETIKESEV